MTFISS